MKKKTKKFLAVTLSLALLISQFIMLGSLGVTAAAAPEYTSSATLEGTEEPILTDEIVFLDATTSAGLNLGWHSQTSFRSSGEKGNYIEIHETSETGPGITLTYVAETTADISNMQYMEFYLYLPEEHSDFVSSATWAELELTSAGTADADEIGLNLDQIKKLNIGAGWNYVKIDLSTFNVNAGTIDKTKVNFMRLYINSASEALSWLRITDIRFTAYNVRDFYDPISSYVESAGTCSIGDGVISTTYTSPQNTSILINNGDKYKDMTGMQYFEFDIYLSDSALIDNVGTWGFNMELRSNGSTGDDYEIQWEKKSTVERMHWQSGWNHVKLEISGGTKGGGNNTFDISKVSGFRMYTHSYSVSLSGEYTIKYANMRFTKDYAPERVEDILFNASGAGSGLDAGSNCADAFHYKANDAKYNATDSAFAYKSSTSYDIRGFQFVEFDLWVADASTLFSGDAAFEITSSGKCDVNEVSAKKAVLQSLGLQNGWNHVKLSMGDFVNSSTDPIDLSAVNYFRLYFAGYTAGKMIDNVRFTRYEYQDESTNTKILINKGDSLSFNAAWGAVDIAADTTESEPALSLTSQNGTGVGMVFNRYANYQFRYDFTNSEYIEFDLYTEDVNIFKNASDCRIDLTSGSDFNFDGIAVEVTKEALKAVALTYGWNHIKVPIDYSTADEDFNRKDVRGFRFFTSYATEGSTVKVKNFYATGDSGTVTPFLADKPASVAYENEWVIASGDSIFDLTCSGKETTPNKAENGECFIQTTIPGGFSSNGATVTKQPAITIEGAENATDYALSMLFYIDDVNAFKKYSSAEIEISSDAASIDNNDLHWDISALHLKSGWNKLNLSFADADTNKGTFDPASIQNFRIYLSAYTDTVIAVDDIKIIKADEAEFLTDVSIYPEGSWIEDVETADYEYTFVAVPDLQEITAKYPAMLETMFGYIADNKTAMNTQFVMGLGDLTWNGCCNNEASVTEYERVRAAYSKLDEAGIEYSNVYGNHDYVPANRTDNTHSALFNEYFGYDYYSQNHTMFGGAYGEGKMDNVYYLVNVSGVKYLVLALELFEEYQDSDVVAWANEVVENHPNYNVVVTTHAYLGSDGECLDPAGTYLWDNLVSKHSNIFMVLSGHVINDYEEGSVASSVTVREDGSSVYQYMINSQDVDTYYGGLGMLMFLHFSNEGKTVTFRYYSPVHEAYYKKCNQFSITLDADTYVAPLMGDVDGNDIIDIRDLVRYKKYESLSDVSIDKYSADIVDDGILNVTDIVALRRILIGK